MSTLEPVLIYIGNDLDRVIDVDYLVDGTPDHEETFVMDTLGNRTGDQSLTEGTVNFTVDSATNRYSSVGGNTITHDFAGNMTTDKGGYKYYYDYENRLVKIEDSSSVDVAEYAYDALGRRIKVIDNKASTTTLCYYNPNWQVLAEYDGSNNLQRYFVYGNYIDEPLVMNDGTDDYYYAHDHLFSVVALLEADGDVTERYEYDAYGTGTIYTDDGGDGDWFDGDETVADYSEIGNPYYFTGRRLDVLDSANLTLMHYRHRTYDTYAARFLQQDPVNYVDGLNLYNYVANRPTIAADPQGLFYSLTDCSEGAYHIWNGLVALKHQCVTRDGEVTDVDSGWIDATDLDKLLLWALEFGLTLEMPELIPLVPYNAVLCKLEQKWTAKKIPLREWKGKYITNHGFFGIGANSFYAVDFQGLGAPMNAYSDIKRYVRLVNKNTGLVAMSFPGENWGNLLTEDEDSWLEIPQKSYNVDAIDNFGGFPWIIW